MTEPMSLGLDRAMLNRADAIINTLYLELENGKGTNTASPPSTGFCLYCLLEAVVKMLSTVASYGYHNILVLVS